ncbi:Salicylate carboxymethyltransferase [Linum perenne]
MKEAQVLHMNGGTGDTSYATNSFLQQKAISITLPVTEEAITRLFTNTSLTRLTIADLGCASGPNTFLTISELLKSFVRISRNLGKESPEEFQVFLNDLPGNDFNSIFISLQEFKQQMNEELMADDNDDLLMLFNGVPGSFYGRLLPAESLHFVHSSYSLHWLSQVPDGLVVPDDLDENRGNIFIASGSPPGVLKAYYEQFQRDFSSFLRRRALEMVTGGQMVLTLLGRTSEEEDSCSKDTCFIWELLSTVLNQMAIEGLIYREKLDSFNVPNYYPSPTEIEDEILKQGTFVINCIRVTEASWNPYEGEPNLPEALKDGGFNVAKYIRAVVEPLLVRQLGSTSEVIDEVFNKFHVLVSKWMATVKTNHVYVTIALTKRR